MVLPRKVANRLRLGGAVAARVPGTGAWIYVEPIVWAHQALDQLLEGWTEMHRAGSAGGARERTYHLRYVELTDWHLEHPAGLGDAMRERPVRDERREVRGDAELTRVLEQWLTDLSELRPPPEGGYPNPPYQY